MPKQVVRPLFAMFNLPVNGQREQSGLCEVQGGTWSSGRVGIDAVDR